MTELQRRDLDDKEWDRGEAEMAIALLREQLNRALAYRTRYDADKHNLCLALVRFKGGRSGVLAAYSNDSAIAPSILLGLNLVPNLYPYMPDASRFGCDGRAQSHTEPKLLNYLCADPAIRKLAIHTHQRHDLFYQSILNDQRESAVRQADRWGTALGAIAAVTLVTEIDCCKSCTDYSLTSFRRKYPHTPLHTIELGKDPGKGVKPVFMIAKITRTEPGKP